jgi:hypothetical protein
MDETSDKPGFLFFGRRKTKLAATRLTDGQVAEWSCSGLQSRVRRFDSDLGLHPVLSRSSMSAEITMRPFLAAFKFCACVHAR